MGPKKPQRSSSASEPSSNYQTASSNPNCLLETSFASLQSPSSTSSITNGYFSTRSQPSPVPIFQPINALYFKSPTSTKSHSPIYFNSIQPVLTTKSLSLNLKSCTSPKVDLIHDDWLGLAPLASPESLSELSSISSRASLMATTNVVVEINTPKVMRRTPRIIGSLSTCADDIRNVRNFQKAKTFTRLFINNNNNTESSSSSNLSYESATSSNKCCSSLKNGSSEACKDNGCTTSEGEFQSAEDILDNVLASAGCKEFFNSDSNILETHFDVYPEHLRDESPSVAYFGHQSNISSQIVSPRSPQDFDQDLISNLAIDLSLDEEHRAIHFQKPPSQSQPSSSIDSGSMCRTPSDITKNVTFNPQVITVDTTPCDSRYSPPSWKHLFRSKNKQKPHTPPPPVPTVGSNVPIKTILLTKRHSENTEECFSRTEVLPLLSGLSNSVGERTPSPNFVRRKKYVYPSDVVVVPHTSNESTV